MSQSCPCDKEKVLKCSGISYCLDCVNNYFSTDTHSLSSIDFPQGIKDNTRFLGRIIEREQTATSVLLEYLDKVQEWMKAEVERVVGAVKQEVAGKCCQQNLTIQSYMHNSSPEILSKIDALRRSENITNRVQFSKAAFREALKFVFPETNFEVQEAARDEKNNAFVDFLDSRTLRLITPGDREANCVYKGIAGEFILFPHSRYCFVDNQHVIVSGGMGSESTNHAFILSAIGICKSRRISDLRKSRCKHATCYYPAKPAGVYVFGGNSRTAEVERLEITKRVFDSLQSADIKFLPEDEGPHWEDFGELTCSNTSYQFETAACVIHSGFIYVGGSHPTQHFRILKYNPVNKVTDSFPLLEEVVRFPCILAAWHTQMVVVSCDSSQCWRVQWTVGNSCDSGSEKMRLKVNKRQPWGAICPPVTVDSNCYIHAETDSGTLLLCYSFIQQTISVPAIVLLAGSA